MLAVPFMRVLLATALTVSERPCDVLFQEASAG